MLKRARGFTLIELMVTIMVLSVLVTIAVVSMSGWIRNSKIRSAADALQNGLRLAQTDALRRSRQVVFSLTNDKAVDTNYTAAKNGSNWAISTVKGFAAEQPEFVEAGILTDVAGGVQITGPTNSICFNSIGRMVENKTPGPTSANCQLPTGKSYHRFDLKIQDTDRKLSVLVFLGGRVRLCDPSKKSASGDDGCPA